MAGKPTALQLAMRTLVDACVVQMTRDGNYRIVRGTAPSGRFAVLPVEDVELMMRRLQAVEHAQLLARAQRRAAGIRPTTSRKGT